MRKSKHKKNNKPKVSLIPKKVGKASASQMAKRKLLNESNEIEKVVSRKSFPDGIYRYIFNTESHHDHKVVVDSEGTFRWKKNKDLNRLIYSNTLSLNDCIVLLQLLGYGKNSEIYRKLYRDLGYSLSGYWEVFYWEVNNPETEDYKPNTKKNYGN